jgi:hypothetical protein
MVPAVKRVLVSERLMLRSSMKASVKIESTGLWPGCVIMSPKVPATTMIHP